MWRDRVRRLATDPVVMRSSPATGHILVNPLLCISVLSFSVLSFSVFIRAPVIHYPGSLIYLSSFSFCSYSNNFITILVGSDDFSPKRWFHILCYKTLFWWYLVVAFKTYSWRNFCHLSTNLILCCKKLI